MKTIDIRDEDKKPTHIKFCGTGDLVTYSNNYLVFYESGDDDNTALCDWDDFDNFIKACYKARELAGKDK